MDFSIKDDPITGISIITSPKRIDAEISFELRDLIDSIIDCQNSYSTFESAVKESKYSWRNCSVLKFVINFSNITES